MKKAIWFLIFFINNILSASEVSFQVIPEPETKILKGEVYLLNVEISSAMPFSIIDVSHSMAEKLHLQNIALSSASGKKIISVYFQTYVSGEAATGDFKITVLTESGEEVLTVPGKFVKVLDFFTYYMKLMILAVIILLILITYLIVLSLRKRKEQLSLSQKEKELLGIRVTELKEEFAKKIKKTGQLMLRGEFKESTELISTEINNYFLQLKGNKINDSASLKWVDELPLSWRDDVTAFIKERDRLLFAGNDIRKEDVELLIKQAYKIFENKEGLILKDNNLILKD